MLTIQHVTTNKIAAYFQGPSHTVMAALTHTPWRSVLGGPRRLRGNTFLAACSIRLPTYHLNDVPLSIRSVNTSTVSTSPKVCA